MSNSHEFSRRNIPLSGLKSVFLSSLIGLSFHPLEEASAAANIPNLFREHKQLDLCLVTVLRVRYWSEATGLKLQRLLEESQSPDFTDKPLLDSTPRLEKIQSLYLEARLGSKAMLTKKIGGGANLRVLTLATLEVKDCINDLRYWYTRVPVTTTISNSLAQFTLDNASEDILESLANIVEFDGLETTQDSSPRSTLALRMFRLDKAKFIQRLLLERVLPNCDALVNLFGASRRLACENFIRLNYPEEVLSAK
jgi:hypothetical protein